jgi:hypothetical protein
MGKRCHVCKVFLLLKDAGHKRRMYANPDAGHAWNIRYPLSFVIIDWHFRKETGGPLLSHFSSRMPTLTFPLDWVKRNKLI